MRLIPLTSLLLMRSVLAAIPLDLAELRPGPVSVEAAAETVTIRWQDEERQPWSAVFSLDPKKPLIQAIARDKTVVLVGGRPQYWVETGKRRGGFDQFFDFPPSHPEGTRRFMAAFEPTAARVRTKGNRVEILFAGLQLGIFRGGIAYTFFPGTRLVQQEAVASTAEPDTAYYYDAGIEWDANADRGAGHGMKTRVAWYDTTGQLRQQTLPFFASERQPFAVRYRALAAELAQGSIAVFPPPHQYFMPRDFTSNLAHLWARSFRGAAALGVRQLADENWRFYPWMNAPPGTEQRMTLFLELSAGRAPELLERVLKYTNRDTFPPLAGHLRVATHFHFAYTMQAREQDAAWTPPFRPALKNLGLDAALIADFHGDGHPAAANDVRYQELADYYRFCRAQSSKDFLIIPAEEPNAHFGGHWMLAFPRPVLWTLSRKTEEPFVSQHPKFGTIYRVGSSAEMQQLIEREQGIAWTAHPRTKSSMGFPDKYREEPFFRHSRFLGAGWKQMPSDLSTLRQGVRSLNLLDEMANWAADKKLLPEADIFQMDESHEVYAHLNLAYVRLPALRASTATGRSSRSCTRATTSFPPERCCCPRWSTMAPTACAWQSRRLSRWRKWWSPGAMASGRSAWCSRWNHPVRFPGRRPCSAARRSTRRAGCGWKCGMWRATVRSATRCPGSRNPPAARAASLPVPS